MCVKEGTTKTDGKAGCGCLLFVLICFLVAIGLSVHPISLRLVGSQLRYEDKIFPSDAIFVPRFDEDRSGDLYIDAFREYWAGNGQTVYIEDDRMLGASILEPVQRMARQRGIKEGAVKKVDVEGNDAEKVLKIKKSFTAMGMKKVVVLVPEYASRRFHILYGDSSVSAKTVYLIKPVNVPSFKKDRWWKDGQSRMILLRELFAMASLAVDRFRGP